MTRGRGVILQRYKDGGLSDLKSFDYKQGLTWRQGDQRHKTETALADWRGQRGQSGRLPPQGFARNNKFG
jgi:topoisomerase-4 subunit A